jgi:hypothetical protein
VDDNRNLVVRFGVAVDLGLGPGDRINNAVANLAHASAGQRLKR